MNQNELDIVGEALEDAIGAVGSIINRNEVYLSAVQNNKGILDKFRKDMEGIANVMVLASIGKLK